MAAEKLEFQSCFEKGAASSRVVSAAKSVAALAAEGIVRSKKEFSAAC